MTAIVLWLCATMFTTVSAVWYDTYTGHEITAERVAEVQLNGLVPYCAMEVKECDPHERRRMDYTCNNLDNPTRGAFNTPFLRLLPPQTKLLDGLPTTQIGTPLPNARRVRTTLAPDATVPNDKFTHLLTHVLVFQILDITTIHDTFNYVLATTDCCLPGGEQDPRCMPILVPDDDPYLRTSFAKCQNLTRIISFQRLDCVPNSLPPEQVSLTTCLLDLSTTYGAEDHKARREREFSGGRLLSEKLRGKEWPPGNGSFCVNNRLSEGETRCHRAAEVNINSLIGINLSFLWFYRQHNDIADQLAKVNPCWDDGQLYFTARDINIAIYQHILYYQLYPNIIDYDYLVESGVIYPGHGHVDDYDPKLEPRTTLEYQVSARWFHTMQEDRLNLYDSHGKIFRRMSAVELTLRTGALPLNHTIDGLTQGAFRQATGAIDYGMDPNMGSRALGPTQTLTDVVAADIMKSRNQRLLPYNKYRELCHLPVAKDFHDLLDWMPKMQVESLKLLYEDVDDVELMAGLMSEEPMFGHLPPTLACIVVNQLVRWRRSDRFWFENTVHAGAFTSGQLSEIRKMTMSKTLCDHGESVVEIQPNPFRLPGPGNELMSCSKYPAINFEMWRDPTCSSKHDHHKSELTHRDERLWVPRG